MRLRRIVNICALVMLAAAMSHAQTYTPLYMPKSQFFDANGDPLAGGKVCTYAAGTSTPLATYTDSTGGTPNSTTITLDAGGFANIWLGPNPYKIIVAANDCASPLWTVDNVSGTSTTNVVCASGCISDAEIDATGITTRTKLPTTLAYEDEGNTWTTGAQDMSAATSFKAPVTAGAAPTASGLIHYDSTANQLEYGDNGTNRVVANTDETQTISGKTFSDNLLWKSGTSYTLTFDHGLTADRTINFPDVAGTVVLREGSETISGTKTFTNFPLFSAGTAARVPFFGASGVVDDDAGLTYDDTNNNFCAENTGNIRNAACYSGADWCAKVVAARDDLPATGGTVDARGLEGAQTCTQNPFASSTTPFTLLIGDATISSSATWTISTNDQNIIGNGYTRSVVAYTGGVATHFIRYDGTAIGNNIRFILKNVKFKASTNITNILTFDAAARFLVENVEVTEVNTSGTGFNCLYCVLGTFINPIVSTNTSPTANVPTIGMKFDTNGVACSSANTIINMIMEGIVSGTGIGVKDSCASNTYIGGTSEYNDIGMYFAGANASYANVIGTELEGNNTQDFKIEGYKITLTGVLAQSNNTVNDLQFASGAYLNTVDSSHIRSIQIDSGATLNTIKDSLVNNAIDDNDGTNTSALLNNYATSTGHVDNKLPTASYWSRLKLFSAYEAAPTEFQVRASSASQGTTDLAKFTDSTNSTRTKVDSAADFYCVVCRVWDGSNSIFHFQIDGSNGLGFVRTGTGTKMTLQSDGDLVPAAAGQDLGDTTNRWDAYLENTTSYGDIKPNAASSAFLGDAAHRWNLYGQNIDAYGRIANATFTQFSNGDTTPSVSTSNFFKTSNAAGTTITTFDDGTSGQVIRIVFTDANTTVAETGNIKLSAAFTSTADDTMMLVYDGTSWFELARSVN